MLCVLILYLYLKNGTKTVRRRLMRCGVLQCVAVCCSVLQCVAVCCSVLRVLILCLYLKDGTKTVPRRLIRCSVLQCVAVRCSALPCVAVRCSALQCVAVCCSMLQCAARLNSLSLFSVSTSKMGPRRYQGGLSSGDWGLSSWSLGLNDNKSSHLLCAVTHINWSCCTNE